MLTQNLGQLVELSSPAPPPASAPACAVTWGNALPYRLISTAGACASRFRITNALEVVRKGLQRACHLMALLNGLGVFSFCRRDPALTLDCLGVRVVVSGAPLF